MILAGLMMSPTQESHNAVRYRTSTPVSGAGETKTTTQSPQVQYKSEGTQSHFGADVKPNIQQMQFDKSNSMTGNFLAQGHHPQNLVTEGGGAWDFGKFIC